MILAAPATLACSDAGSDGPSAEEAAQAALPPCPEDPERAKELSRCVDLAGVELCPVETGFPGDELAVCPPDPEEGMLVHYGPRDYDDPEEVARYTLEAGVEGENCLFVRTPNGAERYVGEYHARMRPNSHHLIVNEMPEESFAESAVPVGCDLADTIGQRWLVGSQDPQIDVPQVGVARPEPGDPDYGMARHVQARSPLRVNMHYLNPTSEPLLREAWLIMKYVEPENAEVLVDMLTLYQLNTTVPALSTATTPRARCVAPTDRYVGLVTGHAHARMTRMSIWHEAESDSRLIYETYDWAEPGNVFFRDAIENPTPDPESGRHGGASGFVRVRAGEALSFECEYRNPEDREVRFGVTGEDEMCNVFGFYFPSDGDVWSCACIGLRCFEDEPQAG